MAIHVECEACGESLSLKEAAAGKRVKCRCGAAISVPKFDDVQPLEDDSDGDYSSLRRRGSRRRGGNSEQLIKFAVLGGGGVIGLLALIFILIWAFSAPSLKQDFTLVGELGPEQAGAGYVIRPPQGFQPAGTSHSGHSSPIGEIVSDGAVWKGESGKIAITVTQNANIRGKVRPTIHTSGSMFADMSGEPVFVLPGAKISSGKIGGRLFTRALFHFEGNCIGFTADNFPHHAVYVTYFDDQRVDLIASSNSDPGSHEFRLLEESLKLVRKLSPGEVIQTPAAPRSGFPSSSTPPATATFGSNDQPNRTSSGFGQTPANSQDSANANQVADANSSRKKSKTSFGFSNSNNDNNDDSGGKPTGTGKGGGFKQPGGKKTDWGDGATTQSLAGTRGQQSNILFADMSTNLVLVDDQLIDIEKPEPVGKFSASGSGNNVLRALSPDGKLLASAEKYSNESAEVITLHSLGAMGFGKRLSTTGRGKQSNSVHFLTFVGGNRLAAGIESRGANRGSKIYLFNLETGKVAKEFSTADFGDTTVINADGRYLANHSREGIFVYDLQKGLKVASMERPKGMENGIFTFGDCNGLGFSPDGEELATLINRNRVIVWSAKGKIVFDEILAREMSRTFSHTADGLQWLPDGKSWLLGGQCLLQRDMKLIVWELKRTWYLDKQPVRVFDQNHVLAAVGNNSNGDLVKQQIPWDQINGQLDSKNLASIALVKPGEPMSIEVNVFKVRFGNPQDVANLLGTALTKRIEQSKFKVQTGQNVVLKATYNEEQGEQKRVVEGFEFGRDTGQRVNETRGKLEIKIITKDQGEVAWTQTIQSDGGLFIEGEISDASVRNRMFKFMESRVNQLALPTLIPKPGSVQLPIVTNLER